ncbi:MAG TPA: sigma-54 dependent transcriptional regulator [Polyangiaceae bacterium]|nr:sigma-54 dependent transcriptional regulator [Polyangiaceae bacterium]
MTKRLLLVDDDVDMCAELERMLKKRGFHVRTCTSADEALELLDGTDFDAVITDLKMRGMNGVELCDRIVQNRRNMPVIVVTGFGTLETAIATLRAGASDFLTKPFNAEQLVFSIERALRQAALEEEVRRLRRDATERRGFDDIVGTSALMQAVFQMIERVSATDATVLITGESGTGKELVARAIHRKSKRADGPVVAINCAALPEALLESELFGHAKGAFTDAKIARKGLFVEASGGTLFLDELGDMPLGIQAKLLRALEDRRVRPLGGGAEVSFDARLVCATSKDIETEVLERRFREDLFYRVDVVHIELPPLRSRGDDVLALAQIFTERFANRHGKNVTGFAPAAAEKLLSYAWPGNVRELQNSIERAVALTQFAELTVDDLPPKIRDYKSSHVLLAGSDPAELVTLEEVERRYIQRVMEAVSWNKSDATRVLGIDRSTLYRKLDRYGIAPPHATKSPEDG